AALAATASGADAASGACAKAESPAALSSRAISRRGDGARVFGAARLMRIRSFLSISQEFGETGGAEGRGGQGVAEQGGVDCGGRDDLLVDAALLHQQQAGQQCDQGQGRDELGP